MYTKFAGLCKDTLATQGKCRYDGKQSEYGGQSTGRVKIVRLLKESVVMTGTNQNMIQTQGRNTSGAAAMRLKEGDRMACVDVRPSTKLDGIESLLGNHHSLVGLIRYKWASVYLLPKTVVKEIDRVMKNFLWDNGGNSNGRAKIAWKVVCRHKDQGGLGIKPLGEWNEGWKKLMELRSKMKPHVFHSIGNGHTTSVWYDEWKQNGPLFNVITKRDIYDTRFNDSDKVVDLIENGRWKWTSDCYSRKVWEAIKGIIMMEKENYAWDDIIGKVQTMHCKNNIKSVLSKIGTAACVYVVWRERNLRLFQDEKRNEDVLIKVVKDEIKWKLASLTVKESKAIMALSSSCCYYYSSSSCSISSQFRKRLISVSPRNAIFGVTSPDDSPKQSLSISAAADTSSAKKARFVARRTESIAVRPLERPLLEYMSLPASQYSVLDAQRIERIDDNTFRCYVYKFKFFAFEVCPVLLVRVEEQPNGCSINLLSCKLEGSPIVVAQNDKFDASMVNRISCDRNLSSSTMQQLTSDTVIEVSIDIPFPFQALPVESIESSGTQVLEQILKIMLPRFMAQLVKDYEAWASGDTSRQPLGNGGI
ncbi:DUF1997 domain-containing protein [Tanacetum coccineum]